MSKYIDVKYTVWGRYHLDEDTDLQPIIKMLEETENIDSICDLDGFIEYESMVETEEFIIVKENNNQPTIEVYDGENFQDCIWDNVKGRQNG